MYRFGPPKCSDSDGGFRTVARLKTYVFWCLFSSVPLWFPFVAGGVFWPKREGRADHDDVVSDNLRLHVLLLRRQAIGVSISRVAISIFWAVRAVMVMMWFPTFGGTPARPFGIRAISFLIVRRTF